MRITDLKDSINNLVMYRYYAKQNWQEISSHYNFLKDCSKDTNKIKQLSKSEKVAYDNFVELDNQLKELLEEYFVRTGEKLDIKV